MTKQLQRYKIAFQDGQNRRVSLPASFSALAEYVSGVTKDKNVRFEYADSDGDWVVLSSEEELQEALFEQIPVIKVRVTSQDDKKSKWESDFSDMKKKWKKQWKKKHGHKRGGRRSRRHRQCENPFQEIDIDLSGLDLGKLISGFSDVAKQFQQSASPSNNTEGQQQQGQQQVPPFMNMLGSLFSGFQQQQQSGQNPLGDLLSGFMQQAQQSGNNSQGNPIGDLISGFMQQAQQCQQNSGNSSTGNPFGDLISGFMQQAQQSQEKKEEAKTTTPSNPISDLITELLGEVKAEQKDEAPESESSDDTVEIDVESAFDDDTLYEKPKVEEPKQKEEQEETYDAENQMLQSMGFYNQSLNQHLLKHNNGSVNQAVEALLKMTSLTHN